MQSGSGKYSGFTGGLGLLAEEARVLGCLLEKQRTTPDAYPLSLNALCLACNQSTNRDPVVEYDQATVRDALHRLERRGFTRLASGAGSRAPKYRHLLDDALPMNRAEQAVICVLLLRGAQTPGELKQRTERMHHVGDLSDVLATLDGLIARQLVLRLPRRPGQKEERYRELLQDAEDSSETGQQQGDATAFAGSTAGLAEMPVNGAANASADQSAGPTSVAADADSALHELRERVARLEREVDELRAAMRHPSAQS